MDEEERQDEDPQSFENISRAEREEQSSAVGEEGTEEERREWERTRDLQAEAEQVTEKADQTHRREEDHDHTQS